MVVFQWPSEHPASAAILFVSATALASYLVYARYYLEQTRRAFRLRHGCQPATARQTGRGLFGLGNFYEVVTAKKANKLLALFHRRHEEMGGTYVSSNRRGPLVFTNDPENIKCALATRFDDWYASLWFSVRYGALSDQTRI